MDTLDKYLLKDFASYFLLVWVSLALVFLGVDFLANSFHAAAPLSRTLTLYALRVPAVLQQFLPVAALMGTQLVLTSMSRQNEVLALFSCGVSKFRIVSTLLGAVITLSAISFLVFDTLVPALQRKHQMISQGISPDQEIPVYLPGGFWYRSGQLIYHVGSFDPKTKRLANLRVYSLTPSFYLQSIFFGREAVFSGDDWKVSEGVQIRYPRDSHFPITENLGPRLGLIPDKPQDFKTLKIREDTMRLKELRRYIHRNSGFGMDTTAQQVNYHERLALVFTPVIFVLLGIPFVLRSLRVQSTPKSIAFCFAVVFVYLLLFRLTLSMGKGGHIPPIIAAWIPNGLFATFATLRLRRT